MTSPLCIVCGVGSDRISAQRCRNCGFTYFGGTDEARDEFDYETAYDGDSDYHALAPSAVLRHYSHAPNTSWALDRLATRNSDRPTTLVEFGASQGAFVRLCVDMGIDSIGYELASESLRYGREQLDLGDRIRHGAWRSRHDDERRVDVACAFETLEHLVDPIERLREIATWPVPRGWVILSVPNDRRLAVRLRRRETEDYPPHHLGRWTTRSIAIALRRAGLRPLEISVSPLNRSEILGVVAPGVAARRAAELGSFRPVASQVADHQSSPVPSIARRAYPAMSAVGAPIAQVMNLIPELGSRLLVLAEVATDD